MPNGTVKWYNRAKRFGFITTDEGTDIYVHGTALASSRLHAGDVVQFTVEESERGPQAVAVDVVREAERTGPDQAGELLTQVDGALNRLNTVAATLRQGRAVSPETAFYVARDLRRLASRLNPPVS